MAPVQAQRTLVKSPPELWAELSDLDCLARHLGEFGEIQITRLEPEQTVAWEGEHASGTVRLEASGWGTRVTLTAEVPEAEVEVEVEAEAEAESETEAEPPEPEPVLIAEVPVTLTFRARVRRWFRGPEIEYAAAPPPSPPPAPEPEPVIEEAPPAPAASASEVPDAQAILSALLDHLGAAHHRPFSRG